MTTFNVDSLDFVDDESARFGAAPDFDLDYNSTNTRLQLDDLVNGVSAYVQQNRSGDLADGRLAQAVDEGKVLSDDGTIHEDPNNALSSATSWVKLGPGHFEYNISVGNPMTILGSGPQTVVTGYNSGSYIDGIDIRASDVTVANMTVECHNSDYAAVKTDQSVSDVTVRNITIDAPAANAGIWMQAANSQVLDCTIETAGTHGIEFENSSKAIIAGNTIKETGGNGILVYGDDVVIANNHVENTFYDGIAFINNDSIAIANRVHNAGRDGIAVTSNAVDNIVANNRVSDSAEFDVQDTGTGNVLDANQTGPAN